MNVAHAKNIYLAWDVENYRALQYHEYLVLKKTWSQTLGF
jgi:hypothetical protein